jgi:hypothetical protein
VSSLVIVSQIKTHVLFLAKKRRTIEVNSQFRRLEKPEAFLVDDTFKMLCRSVRKCYLKMDEASANRLTKFYKDTRYARFVEKGEATGDASKSFAFELRPVGWEHLPTTLKALRVSNFECLS